VRVRPSVLLAARCEPDQRRAQVALQRSLRSQGPSSAPACCVALGPFRLVHPPAAAQPTPFRYLRLPICPLLQLDCRLGYMSRPKSSALTRPCSAGSVKYPVRHDLEVLTPPARSKRGSVDCGGLRRSPAPTTWTERHEAQHRSAWGDTAWRCECRSAASQPSGKVAAARP
jgi:hypothetical protein